MSNELSTRNGGGLVQLDPEACAGNLARAGEDMQAKSWIGELLKFVRGQYKAGQNETIVPIGTRMTVALDTLERGWEKWIDGVRQDSVTGFVCESYTPPERRELGDNERSTWPIDKTSGQTRGAGCTR